ncbi:EI24 domain-containing protein [Magnetospirillum gryphiswaldense]|uniref:EI24 domain-containing protein n=1 Tax=Magnetospirillum gryphiswaldense TaxID=55518 RepID=UPI000D037BE3|nr:EI24 domain-containing protein [Magnetospirillum gryphiswaldense]AVM75393.1 CysZ-like protein [Magnetospirillum gryphiswaldense MSR-1]AVM79296.1 CysZ-like protein [Magnetospirillum gryphiswaldense]
MIGALWKALAQLSDPRLARVLKLGVLGALAAYVALVAIIWTVLANVSLFTNAWADWSSELAIGALALVLPILFFPALATTIMGPMLDGVADAVDARHYPHLAAARPQPTTEVILGTLRFLALTVIINLAALPLYGILLFTGLTVLLVTAINGYLLGREYFEMAALRRLEPAMVRALFKARLGQVWLAGVVIAFLFSVPLLNLAAPVIAAAFMTHVAETLRMRANSV